MQRRGSKMNMISFLEQGKKILALVTDSGDIYRLEHSEFMEFIYDARSQGLSPLELAQQLIKSNEPIQQRINDLSLTIPISISEVWAAGVTYARSKEARNEEVSKVTEVVNSYTCYDKVYDADRPEIFLKSNALRTVGPNDELCIRSDSKWQVPEPELGLVLDSQGVILGYTIGNDMSSRDIEGENPLYLPQAKVWRRSCAIGPAIRLAETVDNPYQFHIQLQIFRNNERLVDESVSTNQLKRKLEDLVSYLLKDNDLYDGTILLTGTGIVPPDDFSLQSGDRIDITISEIGVLSNFIR